MLNLPSFLCVCFNVASKNVEQHSKDDSLVAQRPKQLKSLQWGSADWLSPLNMLVYQIFSLSIPPQHPSLLTPPPPSVLPTAGCRAIDKKLIYHPIKCCYWNTALKKAKKKQLCFHTALIAFPLAWACVWDVSVCLHTRTRACVLVCSHACTVCLVALLTTCRFTWWLLITTFVANYNLKRGSFWGYLKSFCFFILAVRNFLTFQF